MADDDDGGIQWFQQLGLEELFLKEFGNGKRKHEVLGVCEEDRSSSSKANHRKAIQGEQPAAVLPSGTHD
jgi:hypothetical protein